MKGRCKGKRLELSLLFVLCQGEGRDHKSRNRAALSGAGMVCSHSVRREALGPTTNRLSAKGLKRWAMAPPCVPRKESIPLLIYEGKINRFVWLKLLTL